MSKKVLGVVVSLLVVAMLALPMSAVFATKPSQISGTMTMIDPMSHVSMRPLGNSGNQIWTFTDAPQVFTGGIEGTGFYNGKWVVYKPFTPDMKLRTAIGVYSLDVEVAGVSGELTIGVPKSMKLIIIGGTGGLENLHGTGMLVMVPGGMGLEYTYSMDIHFDP
jgi:hypothetical protein